MALKAVMFLVTMFVSAHCSVADRTVLKQHSATANNASAIAPDKYISGGQPADIGQFPWIARLSIKDRSDGSTYMCAGSLIGVRHVLTAAHCLEHKVEYNTDVQIFLGDYDRASYPVDCARGKCTKNKVVFPDKIMKHANYDRASLNNDIALLRLMKRAPLSATIKVIPLPPFDIDQPRNKGVSVAIIGWGETESTYSSNILLATELSLIPKGECQRKASRVPEKHLCAGDNKGRDTCPGDSGGPLLMYYNKKYYVSGIVSYGPDLKCGTSKIGYYTNVFKYMKWIKTNMKA